jgi:uncharacterized protein (TIGR03083 family)
MSNMAEFGKAFVGARRRFASLCTDLSNEELDEKVPACPDWSVKDLLAHVVGITSDVVSGNVEGVGSDEWTSKQIAARRDHGVEQLLAEWDSIAPMVESAIDSIPKWMAGMIVGDLVTHEHDLRGAIKVSGARDSSGVAVALDTYARFFGRRIKDRDIPALEVRAGDHSWQLGNGEPQASVAGEPFEVLRGLTGRRTFDEVRALGWSGDPEPYVGIFSMYGAPEQSLKE